MSGLGVCWKIRVFFRFFLLNRMGKYFFFFMGRNFSVFGIFRMEELYRFGERSREESKSEYERVKDIF